MANNIIVRKATAADLETVFRFICELENATFDLKLFRQLYECNLGDVDCHYYVAAIGERCIGFISLQIQSLLHHCGRVGEIQEFYISKDVRGEGIGRLLVDQVKKVAAASGLKSLEVTSNRSRTENVKVYQRLGFELTHNKFTIALPWP